MNRTKHHGAFSATAAAAALSAACWLMATTAMAQPVQGGRRPHARRMAFVTDTVMVHDPAMAYEDGTYYLLSTGQGLQWATSKDRRSWVVQPTPFIEELPQWTRDSVPGFRSHVWAPDIVRWHNRWWLTYSCSTFGKNTSAIGLMSADRLNGTWRDEGCIVKSQERRDQWNAIDSNIAIDSDDQPWMVWGSFWDGIQIGGLSVESSELSVESSGLSVESSGLSVESSGLRVESSGVSVESSGLSVESSGLRVKGVKTIARRYRVGDPDAAENPTSKFAGRNAIEAPFIFSHDGYYYLFVSWDYCCRGAKSNYRVVVGRSKSIDGPYVDRDGKPMLEGGGMLLLEGDKQEYEAAGHCAVYRFGQEDVFICHGYSTQLNGASILIQRKLGWTADGWPELR